MRIYLPADEPRPSPHMAKNYAPALVAAARAFGTAVYQHSQLSLRELEGARLRTAQINGCVTCMNFRAARDLSGHLGRVGADPGISVTGRGSAPDEEFCANVENWRDYPGYSERERLAIRYAEGLGADPHGVADDEDFWTRAKAVFSDAEIVDLSYSIASWIANGRVSHALGLDQVCEISPPAKVAETA